MALVEYLIKERVGYLTLNRPEKRNALSPDLIYELSQAFDRAEKDDGVKVIVLMARGDAFCAGADLAYLKQLQSFSYDDNLQDSLRLKELFYKIYTMPKVVVALVEGAALAGGCGLVTVCDFAWAVPEAQFGYTEVKIGFVPAIVMAFLIRKAGEARAKELLLTGKLVPAEEAVRFGIVTHVSPKVKIRKDVEEFALKLTTDASGESLARTKRMVQQVQNMTLEEALDFAAKENAKARETTDCKKGIDSFLNKKPLTW